MTNDRDTALRITKAALARVLQTHLARRDTNHGATFCQDCGAEAYKRGPRKGELRHYHHCIAVEILEVPDLVRVGAVTA